MCKTVEVVISPISSHLESKTNMYALMCTVWWGFFQLWLLVYLGIKVLNSAISWNINNSEIAHIYFLTFKLQQRYDESLRVGLSVEPLHLRPLKINRMIYSL